MGLGGINIWSLVLIFLIVMVIFGTGKLKSIGGDLGGAIKGFRKAMETDDDKKSDERDEETRKIASEKGADAEFSEQAEKEKHS